MWKARQWPSWCHRVPRSSPTPPAGEEQGRNDKQMHPGLSRAEFSIRRPPLLAWFEVEFPQCPWQTWSAFPKSWERRRWPPPIPAAAPGCAGWLDGPVSSRSSHTLELQGAQPAWPWQGKPASLPGPTPSGSCADRHCLPVTCGPRPQPQPPHLLVCSGALPRTAVT